jgi:threonine aldolase
MTSARDFFAYLGQDNPGFRIPLHSDTATLPTPAMREAMAFAPVGDEQRREDPSVLALQTEIANALGMEAALFLPSATMANQIAVRLHCRQGEEVMCHETAHIMHWEAGGMSALSGATPLPLPGPRGIFSPQTCERAIRGDNPHNPKTALIAIENTTNVAGGYVWTPEDIDGIVQVARRRGLPVHCDGSRLFNAAIALASGRVGQAGGAWRVNDSPSAFSVINAAAQLARGLDSVTICFSKGFGAPVGAALVGSRPFIERAMRMKHQFGGAMRQAGILAAGALYAMKNHLPLMAEDHRRARRLAEGLNAIPGYAIPPENVQSNILIVDVTNCAPDGCGGDCARVASAFQARGVGCYPFGRCFRVVTHLGITDDMIEEVIRMAPEVLRDASATSFSRDSRGRVGY